MSITILTEEGQSAIKDALNASGWLDEPVLAAGQLRQGKKPSMMGMILGYALIEVLRPRRSKKLPRHFVLAITPTRLVAYKASGGSGEDSSSIYKMHVREAEVASFPLGTVSLTDLHDGSSSKGAIMEIDGERFPVSRPNLNGEPSTDELIGMLARAESVAPDLALMVS